MGLRLGLATLLLVSAGAAQDAAEIMARVAENQARSNKARSSLVFEREVHTRVTKNRKLHREEKFLFTVAPTPDGFKSKQTSFEGWILHKGEMLPYAEPHWERVAIDGDAIVSEVLLEFVNDDRSRDGFEEEFFPLTGKEQERYVFRLLGEEQVDGRDTYRISFEPRAKSAEYNRERAMWKGEAFIDKHALQPVYVTTQMARKIPVVVRTALGTNFRQLGFSLQYQEVVDGVWLPVSYGGEFEVKVLFFYNRVATISLVNRQFRRTQVDSSIEFSDQ